MIWSWSCGEDESRRMFGGSMSGDGSMSMNNCLRRAGDDLSGIKLGTSTGGVAV